MGRKHAAVSVNMGDREQGGETQILWTERAEQLKGRYPITDEKGSSPTYAPK